VKTFLRWEYLILKVLLHNRISTVSLPSSHQLSIQQISYKLIPTACILLLILFPLYYAQAIAFLD